MKISVTSSAIRKNCKISAATRAKKAKYKGLYILESPGGFDGFDIYDKDGNIVDEGYMTIEDAKQAIDDIIRIHGKVFSDTEMSEEHEDAIREIGQEFTSENTSINSSKLPAIFKMVSFEPGTVNLDYGGGRFDNVADYLAQFDVINLVYDPYNRTPEHNKEVIRTVRQHGGADTATCSNVLNVIKEPEVRKNVLENIKKLVKPTGIVYITVYEGTGKGDEGATKSGYQLNRKTADYLEEIREVFPDAKRKGKLIVAQPSEVDVESSTSIKASSSIEEDIREFGQFIVDNLNSQYDIEFELTSIYRDEDSINVEVVSEDGVAFEGTAVGFDVDQYPVDALQEDFYPEIMNDLMEGIAEYYEQYDEDIESSTCIKGDTAKADLEGELHAAAREAMINRFGFPEDEADDYFVVDIHPADDEDYTVAEVRAELSYDAMDELMNDVLDPIVQGYDSEAYFDLKSPGIAVAWIPDTVAISSATNIPEPSLDPLESNEPEYLDGQESVDIDIDADIEVDDDGVVEFVTDIDDALEGVFAESVNATIRDYDSVLEDIDSLLAEVDVPEAGKYHIKGTAHLVYDVEGAELVKGDESVADEIDTSRMSVALNKDSRIENLEIQ